MTETSLTSASVGLREQMRHHHFRAVWEKNLNPAFADVASYYDRANQLASLGLWNWFLRRFIQHIPTKPGLRVLDICAGTNDVGIALLERESRLQVDAIDQSAEMQAVGTRKARARNLTIHSRIADVHSLPYDDHSFDVVTLRFASRHLRVLEVFQEVSRVLKPGGSFHHCDMLRPNWSWVQVPYFGFLRSIVEVTAFVFGSSKEARENSRYFVDALRMFYTPEELSEVLVDCGFDTVTHDKLLGGLVSIHNASLSNAPVSAPGSAPGS